MIKLSLLDLERKIKEGYSFTAQKGEVKVELSKAISLFIDFDNKTTETKDAGFEVIITKGQDLLLHKQYKRFSSVVRILNDRKMLKNGKVTIALIDRAFETFEELEKKRAFDILDMQGILSVYADCDEFSLSQYLPDLYLSEQECQKAFDKVVEEDKIRLLEYYDKFCEQIDIPAEQLFEEIAIECEEFGKKADKSKYEFGFMRSFICDEVGKTTKYSEPLQFFWRAYHTLGMQLDTKEEIFSHAKKPKGDILAEINRQGNEALRDNYIRHEISNSNHCTVTGSPFLTIYFKLNDQTKAWLSQFSSDFDLEGLEDLGLYKGGELQFSSCAHEGFHVDARKK